MFKEKIGPSLQEQKSEDSVDKVIRKKQEKDDALREEETRKEKIRYAEYKVAETRELLEETKRPVLKKFYKRQLEGWEKRLEKERGK